MNKGIVALLVIASIAGWGFVIQQHTQLEYTRHQLELEESRYSDLDSRTALYALRIAFSEARIENPVQLNALLDDEPMYRIVFPRCMDDLYRFKEWYVRGEVVLGNGKRSKLLRPFEMDDRDHWAVYIPQFDVKNGITIRIAAAFTMGLPVRFTLDPRTSRFVFDRNDEDYTHPIEWTTP